MKFIHDLSVYNAYFVLEIQSTFCCFSDRINCSHIIPSMKCNDSCICCLNPQFDSRIPQRKRSIIVSINAFIKFLLVFSFLQRHNPCIQYRFQSCIGTASGDDGPCF
eukprot:1012480_1